MKAKALLMNAQFTGKNSNQTLLDERSVRGRWVQIANQQQKSNSGKKAQPDSNNEVKRSNTYSDMNCGFQLPNS